MNDKLCTIQVVDKNKRRALKTISGVAAIGVLATVPAYSAATKFSAALGAPASSELPTDLEGMLVSIPNVRGETLILKNLTGKDITIEQFQANKVTFDGEIVNCNDACSSSAIRIPANDDVMIRFKPKDNNLANSPAGGFLNLDKNLYRLPEGTRVVPLVARMQGSAAILAEKNQTTAA